MSDLGSIFIANRNILTELVLLLRSPNFIITEHYIVSLVSRARYTRAQSFMLKCLFRQETPLFP
jgi:hypothetical protein